MNKKQNGNEIQIRKQNRKHKIEKNRKQKTENKQTK